MHDSSKRINPLRKFLALFLALALACCQVPFIGTDAALADEGSGAAETGDVSADETAESAPAAQDAQPGGDMAGDGAADSAADAEGGAAAQTPAVEDAVPPVDEDEEAAVVMEDGSTVALPAAVPADDENPDANAADDAESKAESAPELEGLTPGVDYVEDEVVIVYEDDVVEARELEEATPDDVKIDDVEQLTEADGETGTGAVAVAEVSDDTTITDAMAELEELPEVAYVQPNYLYQSMGSTNDPYLRSQQFLNTCRFTDAWDTAKTSGRVTVAVLDSGVSLNHPDLKGNLNTAYAKSFVAGESSVNDGYGHGTAVAGVIAATANNRVGVAGASYNAKVLPLKVLNKSGTGKTSSVAEALGYLKGLVDKGKVKNLKVVNLSFGSAELTGNDLIVHDWIKALRAKGVLTVCASGNRGSGGIPSVGSTVYPAAFPEALAVTATNARGTGFPYFACYNNTTDIAAPGQGIYTTASGNGYTGAYYGTSFAAPQVSAAAALVWAANPNLTVDQVVSNLTGTATKLSGKKFGLLNAAAAVQKARGGASGASAGRPAAKPTRTVADGTYVVASALNGSKVLDVSGGSKADGGNIQLYQKNNTNAQKFRFTYGGDGYYTVTNVNSGKVLDVSGGSTANSANVQQYRSNNTDAQKWRVNRNADGTYTLICKKSGKALDVKGGKAANKTNIQQYQSNGTAAQKFRLATSSGSATPSTPASKPAQTSKPSGGGSGGSSGSVSTSRPVANGTYVVCSRLNGSMVLDISGGSKASGANVQLYKSNNTAAQKFRFTCGADGYYTITNVKSGKALDVSGASKSNGANVQQYNSNNTAAQKWKITRNADGSYTFTCKASGKVLDVKGGKAANKTNIQQYRSNGTNAQKFTLRAA